MDDRPIFLSHLALPVLWEVLDRPPSDDEREATAAANATLFNFLLHRIELDAAHRPADERLAEALAPLRTKLDIVIEMLGRLSYRGVAVPPVRDIELGSASHLLDKRADPEALIEHYVRGIEAALARTVGEVDGVSSAKITLAIPKRTDFLGDSPKPSGSVLVRLRPGTQLSRNQVDGIVGIVASSVPGLARENVTVVDQTGAVLMSPAGFSLTITGKFSILRRGAGNASQSRNRLSQ